MPLNDDDWYLVDAVTLVVLNHYGSKCRKPDAGAGQLVVRGMRLRWMLMDKE